MIRSFWSKWSWQIIILLSTLAVGLVTFALPGLAVRPIVVMEFLLICPGLVVVRFFRLNELVMEWMLALGLSLTIDTCIASILLYAGWWSPSRILSILIGFCLIGVSTQLIAMHLRGAGVRLEAVGTVPVKKQEMP